MARRRATRQSLDRAAARWAADLPERFVLCRDLGHYWRPFSARWLPEDRLYARELRCSRCHTARIQTITTSGVVETNRYEYPDGYARPAGSGYYDTAARAEVRLESLARTVELHNGEAA